MNARWNPRRATAALVLATSVLHLLVAGRFALGVDEAHYALYGLHLDWSYFDHPPMVGWLQGLALVLGDGEFVLRLWPVLLAAGSSLVLYRLARTLFPDASPWLGFASVAVLQSAVMFQLLALAMVPEDPLLLCGLAGALFLFRAVTGGRFADWLAVGLCFGLAGLSKYTAVTLVLTAVLFVAWEGRWRLLLSPGPWVALGAALVLVVPVVWWNYRHEWISFLYQLGHGAPQRHWTAGRFLTAQGYQFLAYSPGVYLLGLAALIGGLRDRAGPGVRFSLALVLPVFALFGWGAGYEESLPHWTLLGWAGLAPLTARWLLDRWGRRWVRIATGLSVAYSLFFFLAIHAQLFRPWLPFQEYRHPFGDLYGWKEAAARAAQLYDGMAAGPGPAPSLFVGNWSLASRIAWYARPRPVVVIDGRFDQFDLWFGGPVAGGRGILIVPHRYEGKAAAGLADFEHCALRDSLTYRLSGKAVDSYRFYACGGYRG